MKHTPPKWADKFLAWYCRPDLLEEIQGDVHELYFRTAQHSKQKADFTFIWNVLRFLRWKNIRKRKTSYSDNQLSLAMIKNILLVAFRNFFRQPGHSVLNVLGLSVGFACAFFVMIWVTYEFSFDTFHTDKDRIFRIATHVGAETTVQTYDVASVALNVSGVSDVEALASASTGERWPHTLCFRPERSASVNEDCLYINGVYANENLFSMFDFPILQGDKNPLQKPDNIAISEKMAMLLFNTTDVLGKHLKIDARHDVVIASVFQNIPANSSLKFDFAMPYAIVKKLWGVNDEQFSQQFFHMFIKTPANASVEKLTQQLNVEPALTPEYKAQRVRYEPLPLTDWRLKSKFENGKQAGGRIEYVILFLIIGTLVTCMAVINFVNMTTARATTRAKEIGIRKATGAFRSSIIVQFISESFLIVSTAFLIACVLVQLALPLFSTWLGESINISLLNGWMPLYLLGFLIVVALLAGLYPAFVMSSFKTVKILKGQFTDSISGSQNMRKVLLVLQLSISIGIIIFCGILYLQLDFVMKKNLGFDREHMIRVEPTANILKNYETFKSELTEYGFITQIASANSNPLNTENTNTGVSWPGKPEDLRITFKTLGCSYEFPKTFGLTFLEGRDFLEKPVDSLHTEVIVTEDAVKAMGLKEPVGQVISIGQSTCVIIGVVKDFHTSSMHSAKLPVILYRIGLWNASAMYIKYKAGHVQDAITSLGQVYKKFETNFTLKYWFQDDTFNELYKTELIASQLILGFTCVAVLIAIIGIAGLATFNTLRKTKEIGVRRVLGASVTQMLALLFNEFSMLLIVSVTIAAPLTWYVASRWLEGYAYRTTMPWWMFIIAFAGIAILIVGIVCIQGLKTVSANPTKALRTE